MNRFGAQAPGSRGGGKANRNQPSGFGSAAPNHNRNINNGFRQNKSTAKGFGFGRKSSFQKNNFSVAEMDIEREGLSGFGALAPKQNPKNQFKQQRQSKFGWNNKNSSNFGNKSDFGFGSYQTPSKQHNYSPPINSGNKWVSGFEQESDNESLEPIDIELEDLDQQVGNVKNSNPNLRVNFSLKGLKEIPFYQQKLTFEEEKAEFAKDEFTIGRIPTNIQILGVDLDKLKE